MPSYDYQCKCGRCFTVFARIAERNAQSCPACGSKCECNAISGGGPKAPSIAAWSGKHGKSMRFAFDPKSRGSIAQHCPTLASQIKDDGTVQWRGDREQRKAYAEMSAEKERHDASEAAEAERAARENGQQETSWLPEYLRPGNAKDLEHEQEAQGART